MEVEKDASEVWDVNWDARSVWNSDPPPAEAERSSKLEPGRELELALNPKSRSEESEEWVDCLRRNKRVIFQLFVGSLYIKSKKTF